MGWEFQQEERYFLGTEWKEHGLVFPSEIGTPLNPNNLLRHFKASLLVSQGVHPRVVMEALGHSRISVSMELYRHVMPETQREALDSIGGMFG